MKKSNSLKLVIMAVLLVVIVAAPCYFLSGVLEINDIIPVALKAISYSTVCFGVFLVIISLTLKNQKKVYKVMQEKDDFVKYEVGMFGIWKIMLFLIFAIAMQGGVFFSFLYAGVIVASKSVLIPAITILLILYVISFIFIRKDMNFRVLVGNRTIVVSDGGIGAYSINDIEESYRHFHRKRANTYEFVFSNGGFEISEGTFKARCLISFLNTTLDSKRHGSVNKVEDFFEGFPGKHYVITGSVEGLNKAKAGEFTWNDADKSLSKKVRSEARLSSFLGLILYLFMAGILYGILYAIVTENNLQISYFSQLSKGFWVIVFLLWLIKFRDYLICGCSKIYYTHGIVVRKRVRNRRNYLSSEDYLVDVRIDNDYIENIECMESEFRRLEPGISNVLLVKSDITSPKVFLRDD